jgi:hypothetical protein
LPLNCRQPSFHPVFASFRSQDHHTLPQYNNSQSSAGNHQALKTRKNYILTKGKTFKEKKLPKEVASCTTRTQDLLQTKTASCRIF